MKAPAAAFWVAAAIAIAAVALSAYADWDGFPYLLTFCFLNKIAAYSINEPKRGMIFWVEIMSHLAETFTKREKMTYQIQIVYMPASIFQ